MEEGELLKREITREGGAVRVWQSRRERFQTDKRICFVPGERQEMESTGEGQGSRGSMVA